MFVPAKFARSGTLGPRGVRPAVSALQPITALLFHGPNSVLEHAAEPRRSGPSGRRFVSSASRRGRCNARGQCDCRRERNTRAQIRETEEGGRQLPVPSIQNSEITQSFTVKHLASLSRTHSRPHTGPLVITNYALSTLRLP